MNIDVFETFAIVGPATDNETTMKKKRKPLPDPLVFWAQVDKRDSNQCWPWQSGTNKNGYGLIFLNGVTWLAHRVAVILSGKKLSPKDKACHSCDNPPCCNPNHLFRGTQKRNIRDAWAKKRCPFGENRTQAKLTDEAIRDMRKRWRFRKVTHVMLAAEYGVSRGLVCMIVHGKRWKHIK